MADFWVSFRINNDAGYSGRYRALQSAIVECATGGMWEANTSFVCIRSKYNIDAVGRHLKKALNTTSDLLVIRQIDVQETRYVNEPGKAFFAFFPLAKKL